MRVLKLFGLRIFPCDIRINYCTKDTIDYFRKNPDFKMVRVLNQDWHNLKGREGIKRRLLIYVWRFEIIADFTWRHIKEVKGK